MELEGNNKSVYFLIDSILFLIYFFSLIYELISNSLCLRSLSKFHNSVKLEYAGYPRFLYLALRPYNSFSNY